MVTLAGTQNFNEFELHLRAVLGLPIPCVKQMRIGASAVILSPIESNEQPQYSGLERTCEEDADIRILASLQRVKTAVWVWLYAMLPSMQISMK